MSENKSALTGQFCWHEITTTDVSAGTGFYTSLLGWDMSETIPDEVMPYTVIRQGETSRGGMHPLTDEMKSRSVPPHWIAYVAVASAEKSAIRVKELGGQVLAGPADVPKCGRFVVIQDPTGAVLALWEGWDVKGVGAGAAHGDRTWCELCTTDPAVAGKFYSELFDWGLQAMPMEGGEYTCFLAGKNTVGGMMKMPAGAEEMPPNWTIYFHVDNVDQSAAKAKDLGGQVVVPPVDIPSVGRFAIVIDPQGINFGIITYAEQA